MFLIILLHTNPPYSTGTVIHTTHPDFFLHDTVEVSWPLNPVADTLIKVVLMREKARYLADWITNGPGQGHQLTYEVITLLPPSRRSFD